VRAGLADFSNGGNVKRGGALTRTNGEGEKTILECVKEPKTSGGTCHKNNQKIKEQGVC